MSSPFVFRTASRHACRQGARGERGQLARAAGNRPLGGRRRHGRPRRRRSGERARSSRRSATIAEPRIGRRVSRAIRGAHHPRQRRTARARQNAGRASRSARRSSPSSFTGRHYACVWCGDSRAYRLRAGALTQISRDHSEVQDLIDRGVLEPHEARNWPRRNVITRALGVADQAALEIGDGPIMAGDRFLLCSDGLTNHVADGEIAALAGRRRSAESLRAPDHADSSARRLRQCFDRHRRLRI